MIAGNYFFPAGIWIVSLNWLSSSLEASEVVSEKAFEVSGCSKSTVDHAPKRSRNDKSVGEPSLKNVVCIFHLCLSPSNIVTRR